MAEDQGLRAEIIDAEKARADFQKWKLLLVAGLGAAAFGLGGNNRANLLLLCLIPPVCGYVDLLCKHITLRILVIGTYLRKFKEANATSGEVLDYEGFVQKARDKVNPYVLEDWVMHGSTLALSFMVASCALAKVARGCPPCCWFGCDFGLPYLLSGFVGLTMFGLVHFVGNRKERRLKELGLKP